MKPVIGVLCPMDMEYKAVEKALGRSGELLDDGLTEKRFSLEKADLILAKAGIGKTLSAAKTQKIITLYGPSHIFVCGVAGGIHESLELFDVVLPDRVIHGDIFVGEYSRTGVMDSMKSVFEGKHGYGSDGYAPHRLGGSQKRGTVATMDSFAEEDKKIFLEQTFEADLIDMESASICQIASLNHIPFTVVRVISDTRSHDMGGFEKNAPKACEVAAKVLMELIDSL